MRLHQADAARRMAEVCRGVQLNAPTPAFLLNADDPGMGKSASFLAAVAASASEVRNIVLVAPKTVADDTWCGPRGEIKTC